MKNKRSDYLISRRETLRLIGGAGAATLVGWGDKQSLGLWPAGQFGPAVAASPLANVVGPALFAPAPRLTKAVSQITCVARPSLTEGPFFVDELLNRSDIRSDSSTGAVKDGAPLKLKFNVYRIANSACAPLAGALVDIWHCDALGAYSDVSGQGNPNNIGQKFLRGYQVTDSNGSVEFTTIYPGYYTGRTAHIHYKVRLFSGSTRTYEFTSQLAFDDALTDQVFTLAPYNAKGARGTRNNNDNIYLSAGSAILLSLTSDGQGGYASEYDIGLTGVPDAITSVSAVSAASFSAGALASEGIAALFGTGLAASAVAATAQPLPTTLGGAQVQVRDAAGMTRNAPLFFVSPAQINFQIPSGTSAGGATLTVLLNGTTVGQGAATIETVAPGLFTANASGAGVPAAIVQRNKADGMQSFEPVAQFDSAQNRFVPAPIDLGDGADQLFLIGFGTGFRSRSSLSAVSASIGGTNAQVLFAGAQGDFAGLDQTNIAIPRSLAGRGDVDL
ncbi:MAG TPA: hypothetical protein VJ810_08515, partial [Blastocatellia bacterium]|nr:hypothetical protein [Blastocatellia bacterium]